LIHRDDIKKEQNFENLNILFGAISYKDQFDKLIEYCKGYPLVEFYDNSSIGYTLHHYLKDKKIVYKKKIDDNNGRYKNFLKDNKRLNGAAIILNTPIVKSSILLSTITSKEVPYSKILSTQLNYTPLLLSLTQKHDRRGLIVANSIGDIPEDLIEYNQLIGNNINYSWVNYSTIIGVEYLINKNIDIFKDLTIENRQVKFPVKLYYVGDNSFVRIK
jgi:SRSO17 transposase